MKKAKPTEYTETFVDCPYCEQTKSFYHACSGDVEGEIVTCEKCGKKYEVSDRC